MNLHPLMLVGTGSDVGKSVLCTALCVECGFAGGLTSKIKSVVFLILRVVVSPE